MPRSATLLRLIPLSWMPLVFVVALGLGGGQAAADEGAVLLFPQDEAKPAAPPPPGAQKADPAQPEASALKTAPKPNKSATAKPNGQDEANEDEEDQEDEEDEDEDEEEDGPLETDRPDFTEASSVVPAGRIQWEMGYTFVRDDTQGVRLKTHSAPEVLCRIGISDNVELRVFWNYLFEREDDFGDVSRIDGAEDLTLGTKIALTEQHEWFPETAIILQLSVPTGAHAFTNRDVTFATSLLYGWDLPCDFSVGGSTVSATRPSSPPSTWARWAALTPSTATISLPNR